MPTSASPPPVSSASDLIARSIAIIAEEMERNHVVYRELQSYTVRVDSIDGRRSFAREGSRFLCAQVTAAKALKQLLGQGENHTFTYIRQGTPKRENLKTNVPLQPVLNATATVKANHAETEDRP